MTVVHAGAPRAADQSISAAATVPESLVGPASLTPDATMPTGAADTLPPNDNLDSAAPGQAATAPLKPTREGKWNFSARASAELTLTNNVALAPPGQEEADLVLGLSLPLGVRRAGPRARFLAEYTPTVYLYARNKDSDYLQNNLRSFLSLEAVDDFFFIDATANSSPIYVSPFLPRPESGSSITQNRTQQTALGLSPYIRNRTSTGWTYQLRNDNFWNGYSDPALAGGLASRIFAAIESPPTRVNYEFDYTYVYTRNGDPPIAYYEQVVRFRPALRATRTVTVSARLGYESNDYATSQYSGPVYGAGIDWTPNPRTRVDGFLEHRFFGAAYGLNLSERTRRTVWRLRGMRGPSTIVEKPLSQRPAMIADLLDDASRARISDPIQGQGEQAIKQFLNSAGPPLSLTRPYGFYADQVYLSNQWTGSVALLGRRNTVELSLFWQQNEPITTRGITSAAAAGLAQFSPQFSQQGFTLSFSHRLSEFTSLTLTANRIYSQLTGPNATLAPSQDKSIQDTVRLGLTHRLGAKTDGSIALRRSNFDSVIHPYQELAVLAALAHSF